MKAAFVLLALAMAAPIGSLACSYCAAPTSGIPLNLPTYSPYTCASPRYSALAHTCPAWTIPVGQCCGVAPYPACPAISCSSSFSYSSSGPGQCAQSYSVIESATVSKTALVSLANYTTAMLQQYCAGSDAYTADYVSNYAIALANAYAEAVATTLIYHSQFVCLDKFQNTAGASLPHGCAACPTCQGGKAVSVVSSAVQAVAQAAAEAVAEAAGAVVDVYGIEIAYGQADAIAVASAINTAVDGYYNAIGAGFFSSGAQCSTAAPATQCKVAVAQALACTFTQILVEVYSNTLTGTGDDAGQIAGYTPNAASCANSYALSYSIGGVLQKVTCPNIKCPSNLVCDPSVSDCSAFNEANPQYTGANGATGTRKLLL